MLVPIGHDRMIHGPPWATIVLIALCTLVQFYSEFGSPEDELLELIAEVSYESDPVQREALEKRAEDILNKFPIIRWGYETGTGLHPNALWSAFVHAGWLHLIGNMIFLWLAGSLLEDRWGRWRYLIFYGAGAIAATLCFNAFYDGPTTILVGASGAVSATLGAFLYHFHKAKITIWYWFMLHIHGTFKIAAYLALPLWFAEQIMWAYMETEGYVTGVAHTAHIGGFLFGFGFAAVGARIWPQEDDEVEEYQPQLPAAVAREFDERMAAGGKIGAERPAPAQAGKPQDELRYQRCLDAIEAGDTTTLSENASRVILDLAKQKRYEQVLDLYQKIAARGDALPFTDGAFSEIASAADQGAPASLYVTIATQLIASHPGSRFIPAILWRVAQLQREGGREDLSVATLERLVQDHGEHYFATKAREALGRS